MSPTIPHDDGKNKPTTTSIIFIYTYVSYINKDNQTSSKTPTQFVNVNDMFISGNKQKALTCTNN